MRYDQRYGGSYGSGSFGGGLLDEFKNAFNRPDNGLIQIILINLVVFVGLILLKVILTLSPGLPQGPFEGLLTIDTSSARQPAIEVNVRGVVL